MPFHISAPAAIAMAVFVVVSVVAGSALAGAGGWRRLAARFPAPAVAPPDAEVFRFTSLRVTGGPLGVATYQNVAIVTVSRRGIGLALWRPFALFHPPLAIPWRQVQRCDVVPWPWKRHLTRVTLRDGGELQLFGPPAAAVAARWEQERQQPA